MSEKQVEEPSEVETATKWWRRPRWIVVLSVVLVVLVAGGVAFGIAWSRRGAEEASVEKAIRGLDGDGQGVASFLRPEGGVYLYEGTGTEHLSTLSTTQQWGPRLPAVVEQRADDCWTFRIDFNSHHWQQTTYCATKDGLDEHGGRTFQSFDFVVTTIKDTNVFTCDPPGHTIRVDDEIGTTSQQSCDGRSKQRHTQVTAAGTNIYLGREDIAVEGQQVATYHYRSERTLSGDQSGTDNFETWFRVSDGLPIHLVRDTVVKSASPIGDVTYNEQGTYTLAAIEPRR
jgi:hypothetical protein